ncbi:MAG: hypothetical protein IH626_22570 [Rhodospirillales bacterium]|nr:hypothetical protein [Rhodospirillales bacterium]
MRWSELFVSIQEIANDNKVLVRELATYDPGNAIPLLASLLTLPDYQSHCIRLEILVALAVLYCKGRKKPNTAHAMRWFFQIGKSKAVAGEDPAEDVFVSLVHDTTGNYRILEGVWEAASFYTQRVLDVISTMPDEGKFWQIKRSVHSLLAIADMVCEKAGLRRYQLGADKMRSALSPRHLPGRNALLARVNITFDELDAANIKPADIQPFLFHPQMEEEMRGQQVGCSFLDRYPLYHADSHITVALPTALSVAARDFIIGCVIDGGMVDIFDRFLANSYAHLFAHTPLLGGPMHAPIFWKKTGDNRISSFIFEVDKGYFISFHLFLPSVKSHADGGFKTPCVDEGPLSEALKESIDCSIAKCTSQLGFKEGLTLVIGCGWGKGYATRETIGAEHPNWRSHAISAADLVRLSWLSEMKPAYFWRIFDGLKAITDAGVEILNLNGMLNLIAWVRRNDGHFIPPGISINRKVSPTQPLTISPPQNLLRDVRAESDQGYDRHRAIDNTGRWCDVQRVHANPFFSHETTSRVYGSLDHVNEGILTSVYEGVLHLWISVGAPNMDSTDALYRLWEMANEWLGRIGRELDVRAGSLAGNCEWKVYIEFLDKDPPREPKEKPTPDALIPLCTLETCDEANACRSVFERGFLAGFGIGENIAERLFVRNLSRAFVGLLGMEDCDTEVAQIESAVVRNSEARCFHLFHAQDFADYVRDTLPKNLIGIDQIDDAGAKIGLGWRVIEDGEANEIVGREECTRFLGRIVDLLLDDIFELLASFNRLSTLLRLVANCEKASAEEDHWRRTSAAVLGLHGNDPGTIGRCVEQTSKCAGAAIASRVLIEIALCVCPAKNGLHLSDIELSKLIARAALIVRIGGLSDGIHTNALTPEITISPLGDILFRDEFGSLVVQPMLRRMMGDQFIASAPFQIKNYNEPVTVIDTKEKISAEFWNAWKTEMGFTFDDARDIIGALSDKGIEDHAAIFEMKTSEYFSLMRSREIQDSVSKAFLSQFCLSPRTHWDRPPKGFEKKDIYPWRFGRRLSFVARPILAIDRSPDPTLIVAPASLQRSFVYLVDGAHRGLFAQSFFRTAEMRDKWWGKAHEGHRFTAEVAQALADAGWTTRMNIGIPEILNRKLERDFGDVDVLAWRRGSKNVLIIECKDLSPARNYSEIAALLSDYQGVETNGEADDLRKHLNRVLLLKASQPQIERFTGIEPVRIVSCLACSGVVPMQYAKIDALNDTYVGSAEEILALKL